MNSLARSFISHGKCSLINWCSAERGRGWSLLVTRAVWSGCRPSSTSTTPPLNSSNAKGEDSTVHSNTKRWRKRSSAEWKLITAELMEPLPGEDVRLLSLDDIEAKYEQSVNTSLEHQKCIQNKSSHASSPPFFKEGSVLTVQVEATTSSSTGIAFIHASDPLLCNDSGTKEHEKNMIKNWPIIVHTVLVGEVVEVKVYRHFIGYSMAELLRVVKPNAKRIPPPCPYFSKCSSCHLQHLDYSDQLVLKDRAVRSWLTRHTAELKLPMAVKGGGGLASDDPFLPIQPSPARLHYRTKLTPHYFWNRGVRDGSGSNLPVREHSPFAVGFNERGRMRVLDIETCAIAAPELNQAFRKDRARLLNEWKSSRSPQIRKHGDSTDANQEKEKERCSETLMYRRSLIPSNPEMPLVKAFKAQKDTMFMDSNKVLPKIWKYTARTAGYTVSAEVVDGKLFQFPTNSYFPVNTAILPSLISYILDQFKVVNPSPAIFLDAFCGVGLFSIALAHHFSRVIGCDISGDAIRWAKVNAEHNGVLNATYVVGSMSDRVLFQHVEEIKALEVGGGSQTPTVLLIDAPSKGCPTSFLTDILKYAPDKVVYISSNISSLVGDVGALVAGEPPTDSTDLDGEGDGRMTPSSSSPKEFLALLESFQRDGVGSFQEGESRKRRTGPTDVIESSGLLHGGSLSSVTSLKPTTASGYRISRVRVFDTRPMTSSSGDVVVTLERIPCA